MSTLSHRLMELAAPEIRQDFVTALVGDDTRRWSSPELTYTSEVKLVCTLEEIASFRWDRDYVIGRFGDYTFAADITARMEVPDPDGVIRRATCWFQIWHER